MQGAPVAMPNMMGDYLEKSASSVIGMQEELRKKAMQMFSSFPYNPATGAAAEGGSDDNPAAPKAKPRAKKK
jgi:polyhydroxyalkanoate synthesis regulator protein